MEYKMVDDKPSYILSRKYLKGNTEFGGLISITWRDSKLWQGSTAFTPDKKGEIKPLQITKYRQGVLLYRKGKT